MNQPQLNTQKEQALPRKASAIQVLKIVFSSFFGVSTCHDNQSDADKITLLQVVVAALIGMVVFVGLLLVLVTAITK